MPNAFSAASNARAHRRAVAHIGLDRERTAARLLDPRFERREPIGPPRHQRDRSAVLRQNFGEAHAEPARCSGHQRHLAGKIEELRCLHKVPPNISRSCRPNAGPLPRV